MAFPITKIEIAFDDGPYVASPTWTDVTTTVRSLSVKRGRGDDYSQFPTSSCTVILSNRDQRYNPINTSGIYYNKLLPRRQIRIMAKPSGAGSYQAVWRGYIAGWPVSWTDAGADSTVTISCFDSLGLLANANLVNDWSQPAIAALNPIYWFRGDDAERATTLRNIGSRAPQAVGPINVGAPANANLPQNKTDSLARGIPFLANSLYTGTQYRTPAITGNTDTEISIVGWFSMVDISNFYSGDFCRVDLLAATGVIQLLPTGFIKVFSKRAGTLYEASSQIAGFNNTDPHHFAMTCTGSTLKLYIDGRDATGTVTSTFIGTTQPEQVSLGTVSFQDFAVFNYALTASQVTTVFNAGSATIPETTSARASRILGGTSLPAGLYSVPASPVASVVDIGVSGSVVPELQVTADSEGGDLFVSKAGVLTMTDRYYAPTKAGAAAQMSFQDNVAFTGSVNRYGQTLDVDYTADEVANDITVYFSGGGNVRKTSATTLGTASASIQTQLPDNASALLLAEYETGVRSKLVPTVSAIEAGVAVTDQEWQNILDLELLDCFQVVRTPSGATQFSQKLLVNSIEHDITPGQWKTTVHGSARYTGFFILDSSLLDGPDVLG